MSLLNEDEVKNKMQGYPGWTVQNKQMIKEFKFNDFKSALNFINSIAEPAEEMNHHPDIFLHSWNKVKITLSTHSEGGLTDKDILLAEKIERYL